ncbi:hypothetical protein [Akkermansia sp.]|uniref:hypothetical protein n=1 Tax=Akkermansia sp. TaxID=1872421 RepID=UPI003AB6D3C9
MRPFSLLIFEMENICFAEIPCQVRTGLPFICLKPVLRYKKSARFSDGMEKVIVRSNRKWNRSLPEMISWLISVGRRFSRGSAVGMGLQGFFRFQYVPHTGGG